MTALTPGTDQEGSARLGDTQADAVCEALLHRLADGLLERFDVVLAGDVHLLHREEKQGPFDTVTEADREIEGWIAQCIEEALPEDGFLGEERGWQKRALGGRNWVVDPIDGTENFANGIPWACSSVGLLVHERARAGLIVDPYRRDVFLTSAPDRGSWLNGLLSVPSGGASLSRRIVLLEVPSGTPFSALDHLARFVVDQGGSARSMGSGALAMALVATGRAHAVVHLQPNIWDVAAGIALVENAGGTVIGRDGPYGLDTMGPLVAGNPEVCALLLDALGPALGTGTASAGSLRDHADPEGG